MAAAESKEGESHDHRKNARGYSECCEGSPQTPTERLLNYKVECGLTQVSLAVKQARWHFPSAFSGVREGGIWVVVKGWCKEGAGGRWGRGRAGHKEGEG